MAFGREFVTEKVSYVSVCLIMYLNEIKEQVNNPGVHMLLNKLPAKLEGIIEETFPPMDEERRILFNEITTRNSIKSARKDYLSEIINKIQIAKEDRFTETSDVYFFVQGILNGISDKLKRELNSEN